MFCFFVYNMLYSIFVHHCLWSSFFICCMEFIFELVCLDKDNVWLDKTWILAVVNVDLVFVDIFWFVHLIGSSCNIFFSIRFCNSRSQYLKSKILLISVYAVLSNDVWRYYITLVKVHFRLKRQILFCFL